MSVARAIVLDPADDVATVLTDLAAGATVTLSGAVDGAIAVREGIGFGHKLALRDLAAGAPVRKYGEVIGRTTVAIAAGSHVHRHNLIGERGG